MPFISEYLLHRTSKEQKKYIVTENYKNETVLSLAIMFMQLTMIILFLNKDGGIFFTWRRTSYFFSYIILFGFTSVFLVVYRRLVKREKYFHCFYLRIAYAIVICLWGCFITFLDQWGGNDLSVYSYMVISLSAILIIPPLYSVVIFLSSFILLNILLAFSPNANSDFFNNTINSFIVMSLSIFISVRIYFGRINEYINRSIIKNQYQEIATANEQLNQIAITDALTHLSNRRYLDENIRNIFEENKTKKQLVAGFMLDIDFFKQYNDNYGHQQGDLCLIKIGEEIIKFTDEENVYAVRYGGEEFFICYFDVNKDKIIKKAELLREKIANCGLKRDDLQLKRITVSIGVCIKELNDDLEFEELIKAADSALYKAKENGRNCVICVN